MQCCSINYLLYPRIRQHQPREFCYTEEKQERQLRNEVEVDQRPKVKDLNSIGRWTAMMTNEERRLCN